MTGAAEMPHEPQVISPQRVPQQSRNHIAVDPADDARPPRADCSRANYRE